MRSGRLVIPCFENRPGPASGGVCWNFVIYSDDHGRTWQLSENETGPGVNETQVVELIDGALLLNMRSDRLTGRRIGATSRDGGKTWSQPFDIPELPDPNCQGSILRCSWPDQDGKSRVLFCNPGVPWDQLTRGRHTGTIRLSYDEGRTWPVAKAINQYKSFFGYSCLTAMPDGSIGLLFEGNGCEKSTLPSKGIEAEKYHATFARFSLEWLTDGKDSWKGGK
jgi:sialidase-1